MISARVEVKKVLLLEFDLPGVTLEQKFGESWQMRVTPENAAATAGCLHALALEIMNTLKADT